MLYPYQKQGNNDIVDLVSYRPYAFKKNLGESPITAQASFWKPVLKVGIPLVGINIFQRFKYR